MVIKMFEKILPAYDHEKINPKAYMQKEIRRLLRLSDKKLVREILL